MPQRPNDRDYDNGAARAYAVREPWKQPCAPTDLLEKREKGYDREPNHSVEDNVSDECLDGQHAPSPRGGCVVEAMRVRSQPVLPAQSAFGSHHQGQNYKMQYGGHQQYRGQKIFPSEAAALDERKFFGSQVDDEE